LALAAPTEHWSSSGSRINLHEQIVTGHVCRQLAAVPDLLGLTEKFPKKFPYLLESSARGPLGTRSLLLFAGDEILLLHPETGLSGPGEGDSFFERLNDWFLQASVVMEPVETDLPFVGGWFIYLGYEAVGEIEPTLDLPINSSGLPDALAHRCPAAIIVEHHGTQSALDQAFVVAESKQLLDELQELLDLQMSADSSAATHVNGELEQLNEENPQRFIDSVNRIHQYLLAGDVFQVNVSRPWNGRFATPVDAAQLYRSLRKSNPAPFAGFVRWEDCVMLSSSPERLVQIHGSRIQTRPIAGTRPRGGSLEHDQALSKELIGNLKERAEHVMLIDLERNDLGRVCQPGSIEVNELMVVETYAHVHHIVSNVRGVLKPEASPVDAIRAVFPGGTITGCPKVRCMEIIAELEKEGRAYYTGSMGYLGRDGQMDLNILIRSILLRGRDFSFRTGAGIVADSVPEHEVAETRDKARGLLLALQPHGVEIENA
jgi:anthranilate synthase component 1